MTNHLLTKAFLLVTAGSGTLYLMQGEAPASPVQSAIAAPGLPVARNEDRNAYFGDLHLHTSYSFDAFVFGTQGDPETAYRFALGEPVSFRGEMVKRDQPLDFLSITDHSENIGVGFELRDPNGQFAQTEFGKRALALLATFKQPQLPPAERESLTHRLQDMFASQLPPEANSVAASAWQREIDAANRFYQPGRFTTLIGYEWTSDPKNRNLHRNVIFKGGSAPPPFTKKDSNNPKDLWTWLEKIRTQGFEAISIPHNSNASNGLMYDWTTLDGRPIDSAYAQLRQDNEPLTEIAQAKGASEAHPLLSANDEFANYEIMDTLLGSGEASKPGGSYYRDALSRGLVLQRKLGVNPYKDGVVGGSDIHSALSITELQEWAGDITSVNHGAGAPTKEQAASLLSGGIGGGVAMLKSSPGNLTGVWAENNTRESIYNALRRRETFATSGSRIKVRFFGSWNFKPGMLSGGDWIRNAYRSGVPMGSDLPAASRTGSPSFLIWALKDPNGPNLDRVQVIKVWEENGAQREKVFDVAWSGSRGIDPSTGKLPAVGNTVDLKTGKYSNSIGAVELKRFWRDPEFDPSRDAAYYLRVLEIPSARWSTLLALEKGLPISDKVPATIQQRAWTSPIWFSSLTR